MKRRVYIIGTLAIILALNTIPGAGAVRKVVHSAQNFQRYYRDLEQGQNHLSPIERIVFSLVLSNSKNSKQDQSNELPVGRT